MNQKHFGPTLFDARQDFPKNLKNKFGSCRKVSTFASPLMREFDRGTSFSVFLKFFLKKIAEKFGEKKKVSTFAIPNESAGFGHQLRGWFF